MYHIKEDKRAKASVELICDGLKRCLKEKSFESVTISDIQRVSGVSRSTFYRNFDRQTRNEIINSYIFRRAYPEICEKYGYRLKNYGQTFERVYQKELASLARKLKDKNITVEEAWSYGGRYMPEIMSRRLEKELIDVSGEMFGTPSSDTRKNMRHFCSFIDMSAELVIKKQLNK